MKGWLQFAGFQAISLTCTVIGWVLLLPFCLLKAWEPGRSTEWAPDATIKDHPIVVWKNRALNDIYGNDEDGLLPVGFMTWAPDWLAAYVWTALRNPADNLKYLFAVPGGPFWYKDFTSPFAWYIMIGYRGAEGLPTFSIGGGSV